MSCRGEATRLGCGVNPYPFVGTSLEPTKWDRMTTTYDTVAGEEVPITRCFFLGDVLQFYHVIDYNLAGDEISITVHG